MKHKSAELSPPANLLKGRAEGAVAHVPVTVSVVEDEAWLRENLAREVNRSPALRCVSCYRTGEEALRGVPDDRPDVVVMDINLPGIDGVECVRRLKLK